MAQREIKRAQPLALNIIIYAAAYDDDDDDDECDIDDDDNDDVDGCNIDNDGDPGTQHHHLCTNLVKQRKYQTVVLKCMKC